MKHLQVKTLKYRILEKGFADWLKTLGYSESTVYNLPTHLREFLHFTENQGITTTEKITEEHIQNYIKHLRNRRNQRRTGNLSCSHINKHSETLNKFARYLKETGQGEISGNTPYIYDEKITKPKVLSREEIRKLYKSCENTAVTEQNRSTVTEPVEVLGLRDKAMLSIYYGCGMRKKEGINLEITDILHEKKLIYVRKTKNNKERYVPVTEQVLTDLENYIARSRPILLNEKTGETALFISNRARRVSGETLYLRFKELLKKAGIERQNIGLHTLRHSIATHLLQSGMKLEDISKFLGHSSLDSTQIYTHLIEL